MPESSPSKLTIRVAVLEDVERIAVLSGQLGYPASEQEICQRLESLQGIDKEIVLVAEVADLGVIGWAHACLVHHLMYPVYAELVGLIVAEEQRDTGVGAALVAQIETWSRKLGCNELWVRCNVLRERAHQFYLRSGFQLRKSQHVFVKHLE